MKGVGIMQHNQTDIKKNAFVALRDAGHTFDEIRRALNCSERTLYLWQNQIEDVEYQKETEQQAEESTEQKLQKQINEQAEHIENLSRYYTNLWKEMHTIKEPSKQERAEAIILQMMLERSFQNEKILEMQKERTKEIWTTHQLIEQRPLWDNTEDNARWERLMDKYDEKMERLFRYPQRLHY